jgi:hypothetical protein
MGKYNRSQKHECWNWDCGTAVPVLGIFVSNFRYCVFAVLDNAKEGRCCDRMGALAFTLIRI